MSVSRDKSSSARDDAINLRSSFACRLLTPTPTMSCRRKAPMLRQGSSQSSVNSEVEPPPIPADGDEPTVPSATRAPPVLRQSSSSVSSVLPTAPEENDDSAAPGRRPIGMLQRRWRAQRRREIGQKQAAIVKPEKPPVEYGIDPAAVCA